jgi:hypothetical protein
MPERVRFCDDEVRDVATEQELLDFVNRARAAGGANVLEALLPSKPSDPNTCLIARGLNFSCAVSCDVFWDEQERWQMSLPDNMPFEQAKAIADALECPLINWRSIDDEWVLATAENWGNFDPSIVLPEHISNAAAAFDRGLRFQEYADSNA